MEKLSEKICLRLKPYILPYCAVILLGLAAHAFMLTNKICFAGDAGGLFRKGDTVVSGRFGLALTSYIMPDISMPWLNGLMSLLLIAAAVCVIIAVFEIKSRVLKIMLCGLIVCSPAQTATFCYIYTCAPYALSMLLSVSSVYAFTRLKGRLRWVISPLLIIASCSIYQGYFAFAASFCVIILIEELLDKEKSSLEILCHGLQLFAMLVLGVGLYGVCAYTVSAVAHIPILNIVNKEQGLLMRVAVAYSAYIKTFFKGYFAYVNCGLSRVMHLVLIAAAGGIIIMNQCARRDRKRSVLLLLCLFLFPLSCYCVYMMADNGYIHSLARYPFMSVYVLFAVIFDSFVPGKFVVCRPVASAAMILVIVCNIYFSNAMYLFLHLQFEELKSYYTTMITMVMQTEGFEEGVELAIAGEEPALRYKMEENFDFSGFQDPDIDIKNKIHAQGIINSFVGIDIPFASEETVAGIEQTEEFKSMAIYPYNGSVKKIGSCIVVRLGE